MRTRQRIKREEGRPLMSAVPAAQRQWHWLLEADGSPAMDSNCSSNNDRSSSSSSSSAINNNNRGSSRVKTKSHSESSSFSSSSSSDVNNRGSSRVKIEPRSEDPVAEPDPVPSSVVPPTVRSRAKPLRSTWSWLLARDGSPVVVDLPRPGGSRGGAARPDAVASAGGTQQKQEAPQDSKPPPRSSCRRSSRKRHRVSYAESDSESLSAVEDDYYDEDDDDDDDDDDEQEQEQDDDDDCDDEDNELGNQVAHRQLINNNSNDGDSWEGSGENRKKSRPTHSDVARWEAKFQLLVAYKNKHGTTRVPRKDPALGRWVHQQRVLFKNKTMPQHRRQQLDSIGFDWGYVCTPWMERYNQLRAHMRKHNGSMKTSRTAKKYQQLGRWIHTQRVKHSRGGLPKERVDLLNSIGFEWRVLDPIPWMNMYERLVAYKAKHGSTRVPRRWKEDPRLGTWVTMQRNECKEQDRIDLLNQIGFEWDPLEGQWMEMYQRLVAFKTRHGTSHVPQGWKDDPQLGRWVKHQRKRHACNKQNRIDLLNDIDFVWDASSFSGKKLH